MGGLKRSGYECPGLDKHSDTAFGSPSALFNEWVRVASLDGGECQRDGLECHGAKQVMGKRNVGVRGHYRREMDKHALRSRRNARGENGLVI